MRRQCRDSEGNISYTRKKRCPPGSRTTAKRTRSKVNYAKPKNISGPCPAADIDARKKPYGNCTTTRKDLVKLHPDKNPGCPRYSHEKFVRVQNRKCKGKKQ